jgi:hypothetical protein
MTITLEMDMALVWLLIAQILLVVGLMIIAAFHLHWGLGGFWPGTDETSLVEHVVGRTRDMKPPSPFACFLVAAGLTLIAVAVMVRCTFTVLPAFVNLSAGVLVSAATFIFFGRGLLGFVPPVFAYAKGTPFFKLNMLVYSPLCLLLGFGLFWINQPLSSS